MLCSWIDGATGATSLYVFRIDRSLRSSRWRRRSIQSVYAQGLKGLSAPRPATAEAQGLEPSAQLQQDTLSPTENQHSVQKFNCCIVDGPDVVPRRSVSACLQSIAPYQRPPQRSSEAPEHRGVSVRLCLPIMKDLEESNTSNDSSPRGPKEFQIRCTTI